jgi:hypothetical protein
MQEFFRQFPKLTKSRFTEGVVEQWRYKFHRVPTGENVVDEESRYSFWLAFGILPDEQIALENGFQPIRCEETDEFEEAPCLLQFARA